MLIPRFLAATALAVAVTGACAPRARAQSPLSGFDAYVARSVKDWNVPGLAIAVVKDDSTVFAKGYGVRKLGTRDSVNAHTLFANASTTKAFTSFVVELMADEGKLRMDAPVVTYLPAFHLSNPVATRQITIADLLSHRTGVPEADYIWYDDTSSFPEIMRRLSYVPFNAPLRSHFEYQNITYALAGNIAAERAGTTWEKLVQERILTPLGMRETFTDTPDERAHPNIAFAHDYVNDTVRVIPR
jgi:CubicO group peptidase (beta-lactamase class C family)